ncbi:hypothetical protein [Methylobacterium dankookense]|uniref:Glycosyltransferase RgtA/B/C/D-like domain-containing protein n=1 Tax=Methylobacterium dankookense TaxID=560405 RepID=A0ABQ4RCE1_9HYPH|nr:hypothetical protein [Methylobacterium dankookense]GJD54382.1 hypothetical protein IFDJLNFL_0253 [Methylobacterium dankookense]
MATTGIGAEAAPTMRIDPQALLWILVAFSVLTLNAPADLWGTIDHLRVPDTDDAMRLVGVRDLLAGQGWYDNVQYRFLPPDGVQSHWSRLVDAPIAGLILLLGPLLGRSLAEGLAAVLWPLLLLGLFCLMVHRGVRRSFGPRAAVLAVFVATQAFGIIVQFQAGRVDHHNLQIIAMFGLALCMIRGGLRPSLLGGALAAASLAIGLEAVPYIALAGLFLAGEWILRGRAALPGFLGFGLGLGLAVVPLFVGQTAPALWGTTYCDALSPPWLWLAGGGLASALVCACADRHLASARARLGLAAACGALLLGGFAALFPACLRGPFPGMTPLVREHWLYTVNEMASVPKFLAAGQWEILAFYPVLVLAAGTATWLAFDGPERRIFRIAALFLWPGAVLGFFQLRGIYVAVGFVPLVAGPVIDRILAAAPAMRGPRLWGAVAVGTGLISSTWTVLALLAGALTPTAANGRDPDGAIACHSDAAVAPLAALPAGTVLAPIFIGPSILLRTPHSVVAAPYHRAIPGLTAAIEGLGGSEADLRRQVAAHGIRYLVTCPARPGDDLQAEPAFATRLTRGEVAAPWLEPVSLPGVLRVWRVR